MDPDDGISRRRGRTLLLFRELVRAVQAEPPWLQGFLEVRDEEARLELLEQIFLTLLGR